MVLLIGLLLIFFFRRQLRYGMQLKQRIAAEAKLLEAERSRLSSDLHDELGPQLTAARMQLMLLKQGGAHDKEIEKACRHIDELNKRLRDIALNLTPRILMTKGLKTALTDYIGQYRELTEMNIGFDYRVCHDLDEESSIQVYRMVQELVQNAVKHSGARNVQMKLEEGKRMIRLYYQDNGKGFMMKQNSRGLGLGNLENRLEMLGGYGEGRSAPGKGTQYYFEIPKKL